MIYPLKRCVLLSLAALVVLTTACGDGGTSLVDEPLISVTPTEVAFDSVLMGSLATRVLTVSNSGAGDLVIADIRVEGDATGDLRLGTPFEGQMTIAPGGEEILNLVYEPTQAVMLDAALVIESNDRNRREFRVPVSTSGLFPFISVNPELVDFGRVVEGTETTVEVVLTNRGTAPLEIREMDLVGSSDFIIPDLEDFEFPLTLDVWVPDDLSSQPTLTFDAIYAPPSPGVDDGALAITYNSADGTNFLLELRGEGGLPDLTVAPNPIDFGFSPIGITTDKTVTITNTGNLPLQITRISFDPETAEEFEMGPLRTELEVDEGSLVLAPDTSLPFVVSYTPLNESSHAGRVLIDHENGVTPVIMTGVGVDNRCPVAVAQGFIRGDENNRRSNQIDWATPTDTLVLDGSRSFDPDGRIVTYEWEMTHSPGGTTTGLRPLEGFENDDSKRQFFIPLSGRYEFQLRVFDDIGFQDCDEPATVTVISLPDERIHIELQWRNPLDFDETDDDGADVDLHFVKVGHNWFDGTFDTYFANDSPIWSPELPSLDIDDTDGRGPENIQMDNPLDCQWYAVGVHYFERKFGTAWTDVSIFIEGTQIRSLINRPLENTDDFWDVGRLHWPSGEFFVIDQIYTNFDDSSAVPPGITQEMLESVAGLCD